MSGGRGDPDLGQQEEQEEDLHQERGGADNLDELGGRAADPGRAMRLEQHQDEPANERQKETHYRRPNGDAGGLPDAGQNDFKGKVPSPVHDQALLARWREKRSSRAAPPKRTNCARQ